MDASSVSHNYGDILGDLVNDSANLIRKNAVVSKLNDDIELAQNTTNNIVQNIINNSGYEIDSKIPENSTVSFHV